MSIAICPTCRDQFDAATTPAMPFCCERCRLIDLGRWIDEKCSLAVDPEKDPDEGAPN
jgi:endogenous inhibitor of DNA gyrase (YacG/DUF329 family)